MKKIKIIFFENTGKGTGSNVSLKAILELLDRDRYEVVLWFGDRDNTARWSDETLYESRVGWLSNVDFFAASFSYKWIKHALGFFIKSCADLFLVPRMLKELNPDILHINSGQSLIVGVTAKRLEIPVVWHIRELICDNWIGRLQDRIYAHAADQIIAISDAVANRLPYSLKNGKITRMYNAVGTLSHPSSAEIKSFNENLGLSSEKLKVLLLGHVCIAKGYGFLASVADHLDGDDIQFILAGRKSPEMEQEVNFISNLWSKHVEAGRAIFSGHIDASSAIATADIIVCPNLIAEPLGRTVLESYALGKPVIAMCLPAFTETVVDGETGWLLPKDPLIWVKKLRDLAGNREAISECTRRIESYRKRFDDNQYIYELQRIYAELFNNGVDE